MTIITEPYPGAPDGMNRAIPQWELKDTEAYTLQDLFLDLPGLMRRRGPLTSVSGLPAFTGRFLVGISTVLNPAGSQRYAVLEGDGGTSGYLALLSDDLSSKVELAWPNPFKTSPSSGTSSAYPIVDVKTNLDGGICIGTSQRYDNATPLNALAFWHGGNKADASITVTAVRGSKTVTGTGFTAGVAPGMFLFATTNSDGSSILVGEVASVESNTSLTLRQVSPYHITAHAGIFTSVRGLIPKVTKGRITCDTGATTVAGGLTKFSAQGLATGAWNIYRLKDYTWVGKVSSVQSDIALTLTSNAAVSMADEAYVALHADSSSGIARRAGDPGFITNSYAERQWYFNSGETLDRTYRGYFSAQEDMESLDLTEDDGDWIPILSTDKLQEPVRGAVATYNANVVFKENETFAIYGDSPSSFTVKKLQDDGILSGMASASYGGGVVWAGRQGIWYYDGVDTTNLTQENLGPVWREVVKSFDPDRYRVWAFVSRNHFFLFAEKISQTAISITKGNIKHYPDTLGIVINLDTKALVLTTNLHFRGAVTLPQSGGQNTWFVGNSSARGYVFDTDTLFYTEGVDTVTCDGGTAGPDLFFESRKFDAGDPLRLKRFKQMAINYLVQGDDLLVDTVLGLNDAAKTLKVVLPASTLTWDLLRQQYATWDEVKAAHSTWDDLNDAIFRPKRVRFLKRSQFMSFRIYQKSASVTRAKLGPFHIGFKYMRPGRV